MMNPYKIPEPGSRPFSPDAAGGRESFLGVSVKRMLLCCLTAALVLGLLTGCGNSAGTDVESQPDRTATTGTSARPAQDSTTAPDTTQEPTANTDPIVLPMIPG